MNRIPPVNFDRIDEMAEGDMEFRNELITAIHNSLIELKEKYLEGSEEENIETIQQIRHKVKPTLALFEIEKLNDVVLNGKTIIEENGFKGPFLTHLEEFLDAWQEAYEFVKENLEE